MDVHRTDKSNDQEVSGIQKRELRLSKINLPYAYMTHDQEHGPHFPHKNSEKYNNILIRALRQGLKAGTGQTVYIGVPEGWEKSSRKLKKRFFTVSQ
jgi:hypothetical protein